MEMHLFDIEELFDRLSCAGQQLENSLKVAMIYRSLPESYNGLVTALESRPDADQTIEFVKQRLLDEYQRRVELSGEREERVLKTHSKGRREIICFYCRKAGHFRRDCSLLQKRKDADSRSEEEPRSSKRDGPKAKQVAEKDPRIRFGVGDTRCKGCWYVDSGCSSHMTSDRRFFGDIDESVKIEVFLADGSVTRSAGIGEGRVKCLDGAGKVNEVILKEVLYIPNLDSGLLSVRKLAEKGLEVKFDASKCDIVSHKGKVEAVAELCGNLYVLRVAEDAKLSKERKHLVNCQHTWHRRFGHRDMAVLNRIQAKNLGVDFVLHDCGIQQVCENCLEGKQARVSFPKASTNRAERILDLVHTDVCGPMNEVTPGGCRYLMTLIDDYSRYTVVCLLRNKSDVIGCIKRYVAHVKTKFGKAPSAIRSDGGGEYVNQALNTFYEQEGIQAQYTAAYSPQQNGVAERKNRTLQEMTTCLLLDAALRKKYWGEAVMTAAYLLNRLPSRSVDTTPFERWFGKKPSLGYLRIFGCPAYVHIPDVKRSKFDKKAQKLIFVGYCNDRKAYRFLDPATDRIIISRDARFIELGDGSSMPDCSPTKAATEAESFVEIGMLHDDPAVEEEQEQERRQEDTDDEFYGFDDEEPDKEPEANRPKEPQEPKTVRSTRNVLPAYLKDYVVNTVIQEELPMCRWDMKKKR